jgi:hypothetical protein
VTRPYHNMHRAYQALHLWKHLLHSSLLDNTISAVSLTPWLLNIDRGCSGIKICGTALHAQFRSGSRLTLPNRVKHTSSSTLFAWL